VKAVKTLLKSFTSRTQIAQNQRIYYFREKEVSQKRISKRKAGKVYRQTNSKSAG